MPCYNPLEGWRGPKGWTYHRRESFGDRLAVSCGQCLGCRLDHRKMWAARILHEAQVWDEPCRHKPEDKCAGHHWGNSFVTLTYRSRAECNGDAWRSPKQQLENGYYLPDEPWLWSLNKKHIQKFLKRLRKFFRPNRIRYYHCGEYGDKFDRPHSHLVLFNCDFPDKQLLQQRQGQSLFYSVTLEKLWPYGFSSIGEVSFESAAYVAGYCIKKITGELADDHYLRYDDNGVAWWLEPEYSTMSRRPGIGKHWYDLYKNDVFPSDEVPCPGAAQPVINTVPQFYTDILEEEDPEKHRAVKLARRAYMLENKSEYTPERLKAKYAVARAKTNRELERRRIL